MLQLWERHFLKETLKTFFLFIGCFYFLYVLIDYSTHAKAFQNDVSLLSVIGYYLCQWTKQAEILLPLALLLATVKVLTSLSGRQEIVALVTGGVPLRSLLFPFLILAFFSSGMLYLNEELLQPKALSHLHAFEEVFFHQKGKEDPKKSVGHLLLKDRSLVLYHSFDPVKQAFGEAFWIRSFDEIYWMQTLYPKENPPRACQIDCFRRQQDGQLIKSQSLPVATFPLMQFEVSSLQTAFAPPRWQPISSLIKTLPWKKLSFTTSSFNDREAQILTQLSYKLLMPLTVFFAVLGPAPFCLRFGRNRPIFSLYALSIAAMIVFFTVIQASVILGENQVLPPLWALVVPFGGTFLSVGWGYARL